MSWSPKKKTVSGNQVIDSSITFDNLGCTIDEDNMSSNSATHVPTQQSVKAYVDANGGGGSSQWTTTGSDIYYNTGNVGIGTNSPDSKLHVKDGDMRIESTFPRLYLADTNQNSDYSIMNSDGSFSIYDDTNAVYRMRIDSSGNVGIGTTSPAQALHVAGKIRLESDFPTIEFVDTNNNPDFTLSGGNGSISFYDETNNLHRLLVNSSGNVGIGTSSPTSTLHVKASTADLNIQSNDGQSASLTFGDATDTNRGGIEYATTDDLIFKNNNLQTRMTIRYTGDVGIGTTDPHSLLHVDGGDVKISSDQNTSNGDGKPTIFFSESAADEVHAAISYHGDDETGTNNFIGIGCQGGSATTQALMKEIHQMVVTSGGRVGIGTDSPGTPLHIHTDDPDFTQEIDSTATASLIEHRFRVDGVTEGSLLYNKADEYFLLSTTKELIFSSDSTERMRIDSFGRVGIGTDSPSSYNSAGDNLVIAETTGSAGMTFVSGATNASHILFADSTTGTGAYDGFIKYSHEDLQMTFAVNAGVARMVIDSSGNLLVGTTETDIGYTDSGAGFSVSPLGFAQIARSSAASLLYLNKLDNDGEIINFRKDGITVGSIGADSGYLVIGKGDTGLLFQDGGDAIQPRSISGQANRDAAIDLGVAGGRFKDLHLSGTGYFGTSVGIGTTSPSAKLEVLATAPTYTNLGTVLWGGTTNNDNHTGISLSSSGDALGGSVGSNLYYSNSNTATQSNTNRSSGEIKIENTTSTGTSTIRLGGYAKGTTTFDERMRIDSSGNVLIGTTDASVYDSTSGGNTGFVYSPNSFLQVARETTTSTQSVMNLNKMGVDGNIIELYKDGSEVGSIGAVGGDMYLATGARGIHISDGANSIVPCDATGGDSDATTSLGLSGARFSDLHLSGAGYIPDVRSTSNQYLTHNAGNFLAIRNSSGAERMRIDSSGNVGIGITDPAFKLSIATPAIPTNSTYQWSLDLSRANDTARGLSFGIASAGTTTAIAGHNADVGIGHTYGVDANNLPQYYETLTVKHTDQSVGKVGIGTTSPDTLLHVHGAGSGSGTYGAQITIGKSNGCKISSTQESADDDVQGLAFFTKSSNQVADSAVERLRIDELGNVGIGTTDPQALLHISAGTSGDATIIIEADTDDGNENDNPSIAFKQDGGVLESQIGHTTYGNANQNALKIANSVASGGIEFLTGTTSGASNASSRMFIDPDGKVGIGTVTPALNLDLNGDLAVRGSVPYIFFQETDTTDLNTAIRNSSGVFNIDTVNDANTTYTTRLSVDHSTGYVGIGDITPATALHVDAGDHNVPATFHSTDLGSYINITDGSSGTYGAVIGTEADEMVFRPNAVTAMRISADGKAAIGGEVDDSVDLKVHGKTQTERLGIGGITGGYNFESFTSSAVHANFDSSSTSGSYIRFEDGNSTSTIPAAIGALGNECFIAAGGQERVRIDASGNVGIGETNPAEALDVSGNITATGVAKLDGGSATAPAYTFDGDTNTGMYRPAEDTIAFAEGGSEKMRINSLGRVLIGTTSQGSYSAKLRVLGGRIESSGFVATSNSSLFLQGGNYGAYGIECRSYASLSSNTQNIIKFASSTGTTRGSITITGSTTQFNTTSDERLKENITDAEDAGSKIDAIRVRQFDWREGGHHEDYGVIAQELQSVAPEAVSQGYDEEDMWSVDYSKLVPTLIKEIQTLRNRVAQLENNE